MGINFDKSTKQDLKKEIKDAAIIFAAAHPDIKEAEKCFLAGAELMAKGLDEALNEIALFHSAREISLMKQLAYAMASLEEIAKRAHIGSTVYDVAMDVINKFQK